MVAGSTRTFATERRARLPRRVISESARPTPEALEMQWLTREQRADCIAAAYRVQRTGAVDTDRPVLRAHDGLRLLV
jgi:hypothetical protein